MAAYTSSQSGLWNTSTTWGGAGWPNLDGDTVTITSGSVVTYNLTTPLHDGLGTLIINNGGTFIIDTGTIIRLNGAAVYSFQCDGNLIVRTNTEILLKGLASVQRIFDIRPITWIPTTATGTSGQNTITVANSSSLFIGNAVSGTGIATNAYITNIVGTTVTLSSNNTGAVSGNLTVGNTIEFLGTDGMPTTTVSDAITTSSHQQGFVTATNTSSFVVGDWIAVYKRYPTNALFDRNDEGYIIHDISSNNIYIREFVGPVTTVTNTTSNTITVSNAKIFRTWQKLIFGTGTNRNVVGISSIDPITNVITLNQNITGNPIGSTVYTTGPLKTKNVGDVIRKVATTVNIDAPNTATQITLASSAGFNIDDEIIISSKWTTAQTSYTDEYPEKRNITAISGNTITLNASLGYIAYAGAFVTRATRDIKITSDYERTLTLSSNQSFAAGDTLTQAYSRATGKVKTATVNTNTVLIHDQFGEFITGITNSPWISLNGTPIAGNVYVTGNTISSTQGHCAFSFGRGITNTANYYIPKLYFKDVQVSNFSNWSTTESRLYIRGYWGSRENSLGGTVIEGISYCKPNQGDTFNYQANAFHVSRYMRDATVRCCVVWNTIDGMRFDEGYDLLNCAGYNNYIARSETYGILWSQMANENALGNATELAYNYMHRCDDTGIYIGFVRSSGRGIHHNWIDVTQLRAVTFDPTYALSVLYQNRFEDYFEPTACYGGVSSVVYNEWIPANSTSDFTLDTGFQRNNQAVYYASVASLEHNYEIDAVTVFIPGGMRVWTSTEQAWKCTFDDDLGVLEVGSPEIFYVPPNTSLTVKGTIKLVPTFTGTAPKLEIRTLMDRVQVSSTGTFSSSSQPFQGNIVSTNFTSSNIASYQSVELTLSAVSWGRTVTAGVINLNSNAAPGWWEKPLDVRYSTLPDLPFIQTGIINASANVYSDTSFNAKKIRLGGRLN